MLACAGVAFAAASHAATPAHGTVYIGAAYGDHHLYRVDYDYDGADNFTISTPTILVTLPTAADAIYVPGDKLIVAGQGSPVYLVDPADGSYVTAQASNNGNTAVLDPDGRNAWIGWTGTCLSKLPLDPFADGTEHCATGDDPFITVVAFTPASGTFYSTGGSGDTGDFGRIDLTTFATRRIAANVYATTVMYDPFSASLIYAGAGVATQVDPDDPATVLSTRDDRGVGENYLMLRPDGVGHLFGTREGGSGTDVGRLVFVDDSASGLIGDATTRFFSVPLPGGLSGGVAVYPEGIFRGTLDAGGR